MIRALTKKLAHTTARRNDWIRNTTSTIKRWLAKNSYTKYRTNFEASTAIKRLSYVNCLYVW